jgi:mRNA interferase MazF
LFWLRRILICTITSQGEGYPFEVNVSPGPKINGVILSDQIKSLDRKARNAELVDRFDEETLEKLIAKVRALID